LQEAISLPHATLGKKDPRDLLKIICGNLLSSCSLQQVLRKAIYIPFERAACGIRKMHATPLCFARPPGKLRVIFKNKRHI